MTKTPLFALAAFALGIVGCSGGGTSNDVVLGEGTIPETMPVGFPIPEGVVVGSTLVDRPRGVTEVILRLPTSIESVSQFFEMSLPEGGFVVDVSDISNITFQRDSVVGTIALSSVAENVSLAVVRVTDS